MNSGYGFPAGAENDPSAPWNEEPKTYTKRMDVYITISTKLEVEVDEDGEVVSDLFGDAEEQLEDIIRRDAYGLEDVELD